MTCTCPPTHDQTPQTSEGLSSQPAYKPESTDEGQVHPIHRLQRAAGNRFVQTYLARQTAGADAVQAGSATQAALNQSSGGHPLPSSVRISMERALGSDLSQVRTHTAPQAAREIKAKAFTSGQHIYFGAGQYQPHTSQGQHLLAHELAHTVQQGAGQATVPQQTPQFDPIVSQPEDPLEQEAEAVANQVVAGNSLTPGALSKLRATDWHPIAREGDEEATPAPAAATTTATEVPAGIPADEISLANATFQPTAAVAAYLEAQGRSGGEVRMRLGNLAQGTVPVRKSGETYQTPGSGRRAYKPIALTHPALQPLRNAGVETVLAVRIQQNQIEGYLTLATGRDVAGNPSDLVNWIKDHSAEMGWAGIDVSRIPRPTNELREGVLRLQLNDFPIRLGGFMNGTATFGLENETVTFHASATVSVPRLTQAQLELSRDEQGNLSGRVEVPVSIANFSGNLIAQYGNGTIDIRGTVGYQAEKFSGEVTLLVTDRATARNVARNELPPDAIIASAEQAAGGGEGEGPRPGLRALAGFGTLNFAFTEWMTGRAQVIIDNEGHITVVGEIAPPAEIELFPQRDYIYDIFTLEVRTLYGVPLVGNVFLFANIGMQALAKLGPGKIYNIAIRGRYSTDPNVLQNFEMEATLNISAFAGLRLRAGGGAGLQLLGHDIKAGVGLNGLAGIRGYVEATPTIGYREKADPQEGRQGEYFIKGHMEIAAQPFVGLGGDLFIELDSPWWSPAPDKKWTWPLFELEYPLPGEFGIGADVDYVIGSGELPEIQFGEVDFSADKFMTDLMNDHVPPKSQGEQEKSGEWQEDQTTGESAEPTLNESAAGSVPTDQPAQGRQEPGEQRNAVSSPDVMQRWGQGMEAVGQLALDSRRDAYTRAEIDTALNRLRQRFGFRTLVAHPAGDKWQVQAIMNPQVTNQDINRDSAESEPDIGQQRQLSWQVILREIQQLSAFWPKFRDQGLSERELNEVFRQVRRRLEDREGVSIRRLAIGRPVADSEGHPRSLAVTILFTETSTQEVIQLVPEEHLEQSPEGRESVESRATVARVTFEGNLPEFPQATLMTPNVSAGEERLQGLPAALRDEARRSAGGFREPGEPGRERFVIYNTARRGRKSRRDQSNTTHAEHQLYEWLSSPSGAAAWLESQEAGLRFSQWKQAIKRIRIHINWSPCRLCVLDLLAITERVLPNLESAEITFAEIYNGDSPLGTRTEDLGSLRRQWTVNGPPLLERGEDRRGMATWRLPES